MSGLVWSGTTKIKFKSDTFQENKIFRFATSNYENLAEKATVNI